jgi:hypothetical protein
MRQRQKVGIAVGSDERVGLALVPRPFRLQPTTLSHWLSIGSRGRFQQT